MLEDSDPDSFVKMIPFQMLLKVERNKTKYLIFFQKLNFR